MELPEAGYKMCCLANCATVPTDKLADPASADGTLDGVLAGCGDDFHADFRSIHPFCACANVYSLQRYRAPSQYLIFLGKKQCSFDTAFASHIYILWFCIIQIIRQIGSVFSCSFEIILSILWIPISALFEPVVDGVVIFVLQAYIFPWRIHNLFAD